MPAGVGQGGVCALAPVATVVGPPVGVGGEWCVHPRRRAAWVAMWFSSPVSLGFHPGLLVAPSPKSPRRKPGDSGSHAFPGAMRCEIESGNRASSLQHLDGIDVHDPGHGVGGLQVGRRAVDEIAEGRVWTRQCRM